MDTCGAGVQDAGSSGYGTHSLRGWWCDVQHTKNLDLFSPNPPWIISCSELYTSTRSPLHHSSPFTWIALQGRSLARSPARPSLHPCLSTSLHSTLLCLCHRRRRGNACRSSVALISRCRLSVTQLLLGNLFKFASVWRPAAMQQEAVDDYHRRTKTLKAVQSRVKGGEKRSFNFKILFNLNFIAPKIILKFLCSHFKYQDLFLFLFFFTI